MFKLGLVDNHAQKGGEYEWFFANQNRWLHAGLYSIRRRTKKLVTSLLSLFLVYRFIPTVLHTARHVSFRLGARVLINSVNSLHKATMAFSLRISGGIELESFSGGSKLFSTSDPVFSLV
jgi:hypothetical protein